MEDAVTYSRLTAYYSIGVILVTSAILLFLIHRANFEFLPEDAQPELLPIVPEVIQKMGYPEFVTVGLAIKDFTKFSLLANDFQFSGIVWFIIDPSNVSLDTLGRFSFERGKILSKSAPATRIVDGKLLVRYDVRVEFKTDLNFMQFPFDSHRIAIILDNNEVSPGEIAFQSSYNDLTVSPEIKLTEWTLKSIRVATGYSISHLSRQMPETEVAHPRVIFFLEYVRAGIRQGMLIIFPLMLIFCMALFSFSIDPGYYKSITAISSGSVTAMLAYRFVIERLSPQVGYFTKTDYIFFIFLVAVVSIFFINVGLPALRKQYSKTFATIIPVLVVISFIFVLGM